MSIGTVTVGDDGAVTGSGDCLALYDSISAFAVAANPLPDPDHPDHDWDGPAEEWRVTMLDIVIKIKRGWAREASAHAAILGRRGGLSHRAVTTTGPILAADEYVACGVKAAGITLTLPVAADGVPLGKGIIVADAAGEAAAKHITVAPGGGETINHGGSFVLDSDNLQVHLYKSTATNWTLGF